MALLKTLWEHIWNLHLGYAVVYYCTLQGKLQTSQRLAVQTGGSKAINEELNLSVEPSLWLHEIVGNSL
jgi:hypothetical protein